jgi:MoaA/NifB/PqqE/SkfB family radical SAM enzyme
MPVLPDTIYIESVRGCNLRCRMCPVAHQYETMNRRRAIMMKMDTYKKIIKQISDMPRLIYLHILGEPLMNRHLVDFVAIAKAHGHKVTFSTNGTLMNRKLGERLLAAGLDEVIFSVDGVKKETLRTLESALITTT